MKNGKKLTSGTPILLERAEKRERAELDEKLKVAGVAVPQLGTLARTAHDLLVSAFRMGKREFARVSNELLGKKPEGWPEPEETPLDRQSETDYARYVAMVKAAERKDEGELKRLLTEAAAARAKESATT